MPPVSKEFVSVFVCLECSCHKGQKISLAEWWWWWWWWWCKVLHRHLTSLPRARSSYRHTGWVK